VVNLNEIRDRMLRGEGQVLDSYGRSLL
jgi:hypothetical protein